MPLPGHTDDSVALVLPARREVLTGDTVLGRGTSVVAHPDGHLGDYLASLDTLLSVISATGQDAAGLPAPEAAGTRGPRHPWRGLPGHGPVVDDLARAVTALRAHRLDRLEQVRAVLARLARRRDDAVVAEDAGGAGHALGGEGAQDAEDRVVDAVVRAVYPEVTDPVLLQAAARTVRATLVHLGEVSRRERGRPGGREGDGRQQPVAGARRAAGLRQPVADGPPARRRPSRRNPLRPPCRPADRGRRGLRRATSGRCGAAHVAAPCRARRLGLGGTRGRIEPGESAETAAARETVEETGWTVRDVRRVAGSTRWAVAPTTGSRSASPRPGRRSASTTPWSRTGWPGSRPPSCGSWCAPARCRRG